MPRRVLQGNVVSNKPDKTAVVRVERRIMHSIYGKYITRSRKYVAHDPENRCAVGENVEIRECPPHSKRKCWEVFGQPYGQAAGDAK